MQIELLGFRDLADAVGHEPGCRVIVTTNLGWSRKHKTAFMGRGSARRASDLGVGLDRRYCAALMRGEGAFWMDRLTPFGCLAVKPAAVTVAPDKSNIVKHMRTKVTPGAKALGWMAVADPRLIRGGLRLLAHEARAKPGTVYLLACPGTGNGELPKEIFDAEVAPTIDRLPGNVSLFFQDSDPRTWLANDLPESLWTADNLTGNYCDWCKEDATEKDDSQGCWKPLSAGFCGCCGAYVFHEDVRCILPSEPDELARKRGYAASRGDGALDGAGKEGG